MAASSTATATSTYFLILYFLILHFKSLTATSNSSFYFNNFTQNPPLYSLLSLHGDANVVNATSTLHLTSPLPSSTGQVIYKNAISLYGGNPSKLKSFSTYFSFSISPDSRNGVGLAFIAFSGEFPVDSFGDNGSFRRPDGDKFKLLSVEFDTSMGNENGDMNVNWIVSDLYNFVSLKVSNLSSVNLGFNNGNRLQVWIDYESMSRSLELRLSKFGENRPIYSFMHMHIDLAKIWPANEGFSVGLVSFNRNSSQICNVYSWSFKTRLAPDWMHSEPLDPSLLKKGEGNNEVRVNKRSDCVMRILSALILGVGLGALGSFVGMFLWTVLGKRQPISPEDYAVKPVVVEKQ